MTNNQLEKIANLLTKGYNCEFKIIKAKTTTSKYIELDFGDDTLFKVRISNHAIPYRETFGELKIKKYKNIELDMFDSDIKINVPNMNVKVSDIEAYMPEIREYINECLKEWGVI